MRIASGVIDQVINFVAVDATDLKTRKTGLTGFTVYRSRNGAAAVAMTTPTVTEVDATNMPGVYKLLLDEDMTIGTGNLSEEIVYHITVATMAGVTRTIELFNPANYTIASVTDGAKSAALATAQADLDIITDADGVILGAAGVDLIYDEPTAAHFTVGTFGRTQIVSAGVISETTVAGTPTTTVFDLAAGSTVDNEYNGLVALPLSGAHAGIAKIISSYVGATKTVTVDHGWTSALAASDAVIIIAMPAHSVADIRDSMLLDSTPFNGAAIAAILADTNELQTDNIPATLAAQDLIITEARLAELDAANLPATGDAIKVTTDKMVFTKANELDTNTKSINSATVVGDGNATPWDGI